MSASPAKTAGPMIAGLTYPAEMNPLAKLEFRNVPIRIAVGAVQEIQQVDEQAFTREGFSRRSCR